MDNKEMFNEMMNIKNSHILWRANNISSWVNVIL